MDRLTANFWKTDFQLNLALNNSPALRLGGPKLRPESITLFQAALQRLAAGFPGPGDGIRPNLSDVSADVTGVYDQQTVDAVTAFQVDMASSVWFGVDADGKPKVAQDGVAGNQTFNAMDFWLGQLEIVDLGNSVPGGFGTM
jgi:hypothetical protein